jgi:hypothetical protein
MTPAASWQRAAFARPPGRYGESTHLLQHVVEPNYLCIRTRKTALLLTMVLVFVAIFVKEGSNSALPASLSSLQQQSSTWRFADILTLPSVFTIFCMVTATNLSAFWCPPLKQFGVRLARKDTMGKLSQIFLAYLIGGRATLVLAALGASIGLMVASLGTVTWVYVGTSLTAFANAHCWGAAYRVLGSWASHEELGRASGWALNGASDLGSLVFTLLFSIAQANPYLKLYHGPSHAETRGSTTGGDGGAGGHDTAAGDGRVIADYNVAFLIMAMAQVPSIYEHGMTWHGLS